MQRILDLDLDFFLSDAAILRGPDDGRLDGADFPPWPLEQVLAFLHDQCDPRGALASAEQAISLDDLHEPSWRLALQAEHSLGLRSSVTQRYEELAHTLDEELGLQPSHETRMMYRQLLGQS